jgi:hypothetical protein
MGDLRSCSTDIAVRLNQQASPISAVAFNVCLSFRAH